MASEQQVNDRIWPVMVAIVFGSFMTILSMSTINVAIPALMQHFNAGLGVIQWTITGFLLAMGTTAPLVGYFGERFSYKRLYLTALIGFTVFSFLCAISSDASLLIIWRVGQGAFAGVVGPVTMTIVYQIVPRAKQAMAISLWSLAAMFGPAIGPTLSGWIVEHMSWKWLFWMNVPLGIVASALVAWLVPYYRLNVPKSFDLPGLATVVVGSLSLLIAFSNGNSWGWESVKTVTLLALGATTIVLFVLRELKTPEPLLNVRVFRNTRYTISLIISSIITISLYSGTYLTPLFLQNIRHVSPVDTGLVLLPASLVMALIMPVVGKLYGRVGPFWLISSGILLIAAGTLAMSWLSIAIASSYIVWWMIVRNLGIGLSTMPASNAGMQALPREMAGHGSSMNNWVRNVLGSFSIAIFTALLTSRSSSHLKSLAAAGGHDQQTLGAMSFTMSVNDVYLVATIVVLVALPITFILRRKAVDTPSAGDVGPKAVPAAPRGLPRSADA